MDNVTALGEAFITHYYTTFDTQRAQIGHLYQPPSTMSFEGALHQGSQAIFERLSGLPVIQHEITTKDVMTGAIPGSVLICVTGRFVMDNQFDKPMFFAQVFLLMPLPGNTGYYVHNDIFRRVSLS